VDIGGMTSVSRLRSILKPKGTLVIVGGENGSTWSPGLGRHLTAAAMSPIVSQRLVSIIQGALLRARSPRDVRHD
jgi:hypothetical protein